jgi:hypothetical protein
MTLIDKVAWIRLADGKILTVSGWSSRRLPAGRHR